MITEDLYPSTLLQPKASGKANKLFIVSGYASATFARRHLVQLSESNDDFEVNLIIGMPTAKGDHLAFLDLHKEFKGKFRAYYLQSSPPVHCKLYSWYTDEIPYLGFTGSANYSQYGFFNHLQINQLMKDDPEEIKRFYDSLLKRSIFLPDHEVIVPISHKVFLEGSILPGTIEWEIPNVRVTISLLTKKGELPEISGLNWGQRREKRINRITKEVTYVTREPNQAYLSLRNDSRREGFLPEIAFTFSLITDDGHSFDCVVAQQGRKAIHSTNDNSELGRYFRNRLGVALGEPVTVNDLENYGRTDYTLEKIDEETFLLDFSVPK